MDLFIIIQLILLLVLLTFSALISGSEIAFFSLSNSEIENNFDENDKKAEIIKDLLKILDNEKEKIVFDDASWLLLDQARIIEGQPVSNPNKFARRMNTLLQRGISL